MIGGVQGGYGSLAIYDEVSCEVDIVESACQTGITLGVTCNVTQERLGEIVHELDVSTIGTDIEVDGIVNR